MNKANKKNLYFIKCKIIVLVSNQNLVQIVNCIDCDFKKFTAIDKKDLNYYLKNWAWEQNYVIINLKTSIKC